MSNESVTLGVIPVEYELRVKVAGKWQRRVRLADGVVHVPVSGRAAPGRIIVDSETVMRDLPAMIGRAIAAASEEDT